MKRLSYFIVAALMVAVVISCKKDSGKDSDGGLNLINLWTSGRTADPLWAEICYDINSVSECRREYTNPIRPVKDK